MGHPIFFEFSFKARGAPPTGVLATIIGQHLFGGLKRRHRLTVNFDDRFGRRTAEEIRPDDKARIVIQESDDISITATEPKGEDIRLPHLVGSGALEKARSSHVALSLWSFGSRRQELGLMELLSHGFWTGLKKEHPAQPLRDAFDPKARVLLF